jgi:predicted ribosome quality control (RQC) complex YloA/Tae2 family protein
VQSDAHTLALRLRTAGPHALSPSPLSASAAAALSSSCSTPTGPHRYWLYVSWHPTAARLCASASDPPRGAASEAYGFGEQAGRLLKGLALCRVSLPRAWERAAALDFGPRPSEPATRRLYAEVMGKHSNAVLTDAGSGAGVVDDGWGGSSSSDGGGGEPAATMARATGGRAGKGSGGGGGAARTKRQQRMMLQQQEEEEQAALNARREPSPPPPQAPQQQPRPALGERGVQPPTTTTREAVLAAGLQVGERQSSLRQLAAGRPFEPPPAALGLSAMASGLLPDLGEALGEWRRNVEGASGLLLQAAEEEQRQRQGRPQQRGGPSSPSSSSSCSSWQPSFADCLVRAYIGVSPALAAEVASAAGLEQQSGEEDNEGAPAASGRRRRRRRGPATLPPSALSDDDWARAHAAWQRWLAFVEAAHAVLLLPPPPPQRAAQAGPSPLLLLQEEGRGGTPWLDASTGRYSAVGLLPLTPLGDDDSDSSSPAPYPSANALLDALHGPASQARAAHAQLHARLTSATRTLWSRCEGRAAAFRKQLLAAEAADAVRREADLVMANLYRIPDVAVVSDAAAGRGGRASSVDDDNAEDEEEEEEEGGGGGTADDQAPCALGADGAWRVTLQDWETGEDVTLSLDGVGGALLPPSAVQQLRRDAKKKKQPQSQPQHTNNSASQSRAAAQPLSPREHAEALYKRARKLRRAVDAVAPLLAAAEAEAAYLAELAASLEALERYQGPDDLAALRGVEAELRQLQQGGQSGGGGGAGGEAALAAKGAAKGRKAAKQRERAAQQQQGSSKGSAAARGGGGEDAGAAATVDGARPRRFVSPGGRVVLVGRHNRQNDALSLKAAAPNDVWMHVRGVPGSHVVLRAGPAASSASSASPLPSSPLAPDVPEPCLQFAADLAVFYSKARQSGRADVVVCRAGELKKPKGARPGQVTVGREMGNVVGRPDRVAEVADASGGGGGGGG